MINSLIVKALQLNKSCFLKMRFVETKHCVILSSFALSMTQALKNKRKKSITYKFINVESEHNIAHFLHKKLHFYIKLIITV